MTRTLPLLCIALAFAPRSTARAQPADTRGQPASGVDVTLAALHDRSVAADPRIAQLQLEATRAELRQRNITVERRPSIRTDALGQYQSDVPTPPPVVAGGQPLWAPPHQTWDASIRVDQPLFEPSIAPRLAVERAALAEAQARVRTAVFGLRQEVNESFFTALLLQERIDAIRATQATIEAILADAVVRVRERTALPSEAATLEATLLERRRDEVVMKGDRRAALARLSELARLTFAEGDRLSLPDLGEAVRRARERRATVRARPEYEQFGRTRERLAEQRAAAAVQQQPRISAFGRLGYGKPGLNFINNEFDTYWAAGLQMQWMPWKWGSPDREQQALTVQAEIVAADEAAFVAGIDRAVQVDLAHLDRMAETLILDDRIVALREQVDRETRLRYDERVATVFQYLEQTSDLLDARLARATHRVDLGRAEARFLTTLGLEAR